MLIWLCILIRIVSNPFSNALQKLLTRHGASSLAVVCLTHGLLSLVCVPFLIVDRPPLDNNSWLAGFWPNIAICTLLTVAGNALLVEAVKLSDLSVLGPINAYKSVVSLVPGMILLGEFPGSVGLSGIALIVVGSYFIVDKNPAAPGQNAFVRFFQERGVQYRFAALALSAIEAIFFKRALLASSPPTAFAFWAVLGFGVSLAAIFLLHGAEQRNGDLGVLRANRRICCLLFATTGLMQLSTSFILAGFQVGYALALFQTSTLISVVLGHKLFQEGHFLERLFGSVVMLAGAVLVIMSSS
jgi:drug/metabolite transporter (DMT)-like permease